MRRVALLVVPFAALALVAGCSQDDDSCAVGTWEADNDMVLDAMGLSSLDAGIDVSVDGLFGLDMSKDGNVDGTWDMTLQLSDAEHEAEGKIDVTFDGTYSGSDDDLELTLKAGEGEMTMTTDGQTETTDAADFMGQGETWTATCSGSTMTVTMPGDAEVTFTRK